MIKNNEGRTDKTLWTATEEGAPIHFRQFQNGYEEAEYIAGAISQKVREGIYDYKDCAILYRTNAQSRLFEEKFLIANIPYKIVGGVNFYARKEIKDLLAYMKTIDNGKDDVAVKRIINVPKRGIGAATLGKVQDYADAYGISFYQALRQAEEIPTLGRGSAKVRPFVEFIQKFRSQIEYLSVKELLEKLIEETGYVKELEAEDTDEAKARIENIDELISKAASYEDEAEDPSLSGFLEEVALIADIDSVEESDNRVLLMTLHSAKGLEFPNVYLAGMEDGIFPGYMTIVGDDPQDMEEERRLCYVAITRAKEQLYITKTISRTIHGKTMPTTASRFFKEIPVEYLEDKTTLQPKVAKVMQDLGVRNASAPKKEVYMTKGFGSSVKSSGSTDYSKFKAGDAVEHRTFGRGEILKATPCGNDCILEIQFESIGFKRLMAAFAKVKKIN